MMKKFLALPLFLAGLSILPVPSFAQDRNLSEMEVKKLFEELVLQEISLVDTDEVTLKDKQRRQIADQILFHYTEDAKMKYKHLVLNEKNQIAPLQQGYHDYLTYKAALSQDNKARNMSGEYKIKKLELMGQRAEADVNFVYHYQIVADKFGDLIKYKADVVTKGECAMDIKVDYDNIPRISYENCDVRSYVSNIDIDKPDFMQDAEAQASFNIMNNINIRK
ncbi:MAG: hypothetical protein H6857_00395 [Rhodospirillales bacterium]|nr:hypothetical protein [Rhodospirillales bacterium]MCB9979852.1 hypothetical protein [Rhodospirillales bacterium]